MKKPSTIQIKTQTEVIYTLQVLSDDIDNLSTQITELLSDNQQLQHAPVILAIEDKNIQANELAILVEILTQHNVVTVGVRTHKQELIDFAKFSGLAVFGEALTFDKTKEASCKEGKNQSFKPCLEQAYQPPHIINNKVRASAQIVTKERDLVLLNTVKAGAEVMADGSIFAYKEVAGKIFAGISGDKQAIIFIQSFNAQLACIAGVYRRFDKTDPKLYARPVVISLVEDRLNFQIV